MVQILVLELELTGGAKFYSIRLVVLAVLLNCWNCHTLNAKIPRGCQSEVAGTDAEVIVDLLVGSNALVATIGLANTRRNDIWN